MRRILYNAFISCSHGEIRFLRSKKTRIENNRGIDSWDRIPSVPEPGIEIGLDSKNVVILQPFCKGERAGEIEYVL